MSSISSHYKPFLVFPKEEITEFVELRVANSIVHDNVNCKYSCTTDTYEYSDTGEWCWSYREIETEDFHVYVDGKCTRCSATTATHQDKNYSIRTIMNYEKI